MTGLMIYNARRQHKLTSSSAIVERSCDACSTSNRKPVNFRLKGYVSHWSLWTVR